MSKLETRAQVLWLDANRIIHVETKAGFSIGLTDAEETIRACAELTGGGCRPALIDMQNSQGIDRDARTFFRQRLP